jgi:hypothetical protein
VNIVRDAGSVFLQQFAARALIPAGILFVLSFGLIVLGSPRHVPSTPTSVQG